MGLTDVYPTSAPNDKRQPRERQPDYPIAGFGGKVATSFRVRRVYQLTTPYISRLLW
ncbi:hypothetical protein DACRYDRAFT_21065 [Dacryopinax primogenitus]|uniref:Uncharacterized protein n=1 Tax=Dacryopinax primogenitus (strain DJM 731) TaxID=1858805 RepID=M5GBP8_DACPD|nr:uncharacterized protein DACRYDRAFT_21065 [Dacryopinax primogenitus]EJU03487.1 hypothetical protein DACRYDRAFT_21065 [Dacryopinax primogenitus]